MSRRPRDAIGVIDCPMCGDEAEVRRCAGPGRRTLYWVCRCGKIEPAKQDGQAYILDHAEIFTRAEIISAPRGVPAGPSPIAPTPEPVPVPGDDDDDLFSF